MVEIDARQVGQRIDNFLLTQLKGVPKSRIYRLIRKGEVRINKKRIKPEYKLQLADQVRIPPVRVAQRTGIPAPSASMTACLLKALVYEDESLLVLNKPSGLAVHAGTGVQLGMIEALRQIRQDPHLELVHRLDKGTSGCVVIARNLQTLNFLSTAFRNRKVSKVYHALVSGHWPGTLDRVDAPLQRQPERNGERRVQSDSQGKEAVTRFRVLEYLADHTLVEARPETGRTHQIRVHAQLAGHAISGDQKYQTDETLARDRKLGINRLCLHAAALTLPMPGGELLQLEAPLEESFQRILTSLRASGL